MRYLQSHYSVSERHACCVMRSSRSVHRYVSRRPPQDALRRRIRGQANSRVRYGYRRIHILLKREGVHVNKKRVHRLYCLEGLQLRAKRPRRHVSAATRQPPRSKPQAPNVAWSMDFVADQTSVGKKFRALTIVDVFTRECLAVEPGHKLGGNDVIRVLGAIAAKRGAPKRIYFDNGSEFTGRLVDLWGYANKVTLEFSRPGKPTDNAYIEFFNGSLQDECLNDHWFEDLTDAREKMQAWQRGYNESRPHQSPNDLSPLQYKARWAERQSEIR